MNAPRFAVDHPDYGLELDQALEPMLTAAIDRALAAGWSSDALWPALRSLVANLERAAMRTGGPIRRSPMQRQGLPNPIE